MGKSLFEYANERQNEMVNEKKNTYTSQKQCEKTFDEKSVKEQVNKYSKLSQGELMSELFSKVSEQKKNGEFNFSELASRIEGIKPMLTSEQIRNLDNLLNQIK